MVGSYKRRYLLTGDIGGTNSRMGLYDVSSSIPLCEKTYRNQDHFKDGPSDGIFEKQVVAPFLKHCWKTVHGLVAIDLAEIVACLACAGPVSDNACAMSNLGFIMIDGDAIANNTHCSDPYLVMIKSCRVINDFVAQGYGCLTLEPHELRELMPDSHSKIDPCGPKVCVGAGTGLGECYLTVGPDGSYECYPSEGGHVEFSPRTELEVKMLRFLMEKFKQKHRVSIERVMSGPGLANVYEFLANEYPHKVDPDVHEKFLNAGDLQGKVVSDNAKEGTLCHEAIRIAFSAYGSECGNCAIKFIPSGGLFVTGGMTPKNLHFIEGKDSEFMRAYVDKGRVSPILDTVPLFAVTTEDLGVRGAHKAALIEYEKLCQAEMLEASEHDRQKPIIIENGYGPYMLVATTILAVAAGVLVGRIK